MIVIISEKMFDIDVIGVGGLLFDMQEEGYDKVDLGSNFCPVAFSYFLEKNRNIDNRSLVSAYKIAHFLRADAHLKVFGEELSKRIDICATSELNEIISCFEKI